MAVGLAGGGGKKVRQAGAPAADDARTFGKRAAKLSGQALHHQIFEGAGAAGPVFRGNGDKDGDLRRRAAQRLGHQVGHLRKAFLDRRGGEFGEEGRGLPTIDARRPGSTKGWRPTVGSQRLPVSDPMIWPRMPGDAWMGHRGQARTTCQNR